MVTFLCLVGSVRGVTYSDVQCLSPPREPPSQHCEEEKRGGLEAGAESARARGLQEEEEEEESLCVLCLAPLEPPQPCCFTTCCGHSFHITCTLRLENSQCPVCRCCSAVLCSHMSSSHSAT